MPISVLYIHHCGSFGGASRSIYELISGFPENAVNPVMITQRGSSSVFFRKAGINTIESIGLSQFDNTRYSYYRGLRWFILLRELAYIPATFIALMKAKKRWKTIDLIHINEITNIPVILLALLVFDKPIVVHARSVQRNRQKSLRDRLINKIMMNDRIRRIIAIDEMVNNSLTVRFKSNVVHNSFTADMTKLKTETANETPKSHKPLIIGFVGNLLKVKGIFELVEAARRCKEAGLSVRFIIVGYIPPAKLSLTRLVLKKTGIIQDSTKEILDLIEKLNLHSIIELKDFSSNISQLYNTFDVLLFPSHLDAIGRPVIEAAFSRIPSIVAIKEPFDDTFIDGETGIAVNLENPDSVFSAVRFFEGNRMEAERMGQNAFELACKNFDPQKNAMKVLEIYRAILS